MPCQGHVRRTLCGTESFTSSTVPAKSLHVLYQSLLDRTGQIKTGPDGADRQVKSLLLLLLQSVLARIQAFTATRWCRVLACHRGHPLLCSTRADLGAGQPTGFSLPGWPVVAGRGSRQYGRRHGMAWHGQCLACLAVQALSQSRPRATQPNGREHQHDGHLDGFQGREAERHD